MSPEWAAEETRLWNAMFAQHTVDSTRRSTRLLAADKKRGIGHEQSRRRHRMVTEEEAIARSWKAYRAWLEH